MVDISEGEIICPKCEGRGTVTKMVPSVVDPKAYVEAIITCKKCNGDGKLDWIQRVVGVDPKILSMDIETMRPIGARIGKPVNVVDSMIILNHQEECHNISVSVLKHRRSNNG